MTLADIRTKLAAGLDDLLAKFQNGQPAIYVGEPPADWTVNYATGNIQCNIEITPAVTALQIYQRSSLTQAARVRIVSHGVPKTQYEAVARVAAMFPDATIQEIPRNERLGIMAQHLITINILRS